jgi:tetratricopeptide (TPR) repeat protein
VILNRGENRLDLALEPVIRIARSIGLHSMVPIGERLLVAAIPEAELPDRLECLLRESGASIPILQAASRVAASRGEDTEWVGHLAAAGEKFLEVGELTLASKMFMALRAMKPDSVLARRGMQGIIACGAQAVEAGKSFEILEGTLEKHQGNLPRSLAVCQEFLAKFPNHVPCLERTASLLAQQGNNSEAAQILLGLAKRSMYREEDEPARRYLQRVLQTDYECDEALLYLVALEPPGEEAPGEISEFKTWVFMREGLLEAAIYHTRKKLTGGATDLPLLHKILKLTETAGQDPGSVLLEAGRIAWEGRQIPLARKYFDSAYRATTDKAGLLDQLMRWEGIDEIFPMVDLLRVSTDPGKVLSLTEPGLLPPLSEPGILDPQ